jgi:hypothetical protein
MPQRGASIIKHRLNSRLLEHRRTRKDAATSTSQRAREEESRKSIMFYKQVGTGESTIFKDTSPHSK